MKVIFTFILSLFLGILLFFGAVIGMSASLVGEGSLPEAEEITFDGIALDVNGYAWHIPLIGGMIDKAMTSPSDLTVQKLGSVAVLQPQFTLPDWANYGYITVTNAADETVFAGSAAEYEAFSYPANGDYKVTAQFWHLPQSSSPDGWITAFEESKIIGSFYKNSGVEAPAQPTGYYSYHFRFTLAASAIVTLSSDSASVGEVVAVQISGILEGNVPTIETDLGDITALAYDGGYRAYIPVAYNTSGGAHAVTITVGDEVFEQTITVVAVDHDKVTLEEAEYSGTTAENTEYREVIWPLYDGAITEKAWLRAWTCPVSGYEITVDYNDAKYYSDAFIGYSNSVIFALEEGDGVFAPAGGTVVYAGYLGLTGNTIVIDHGQDVRTYLYGLAEITVAEGDVLTQGQSLGTSTSSLTLDIKIGNKSISPWALFRGQGGMFWGE